LTEWVVWSRDYARLYANGTIEPREPLKSPKVIVRVRVRVRDRDRVRVMNKVGTTLGLNKAQNS